MSAKNTEISMDWPGIGVSIPPNLQFGQELQRTREGSGKWLIFAGFHGLGSGVGGFHTPKWRFNTTTKRDRSSKQGFSKWPVKCHIFWVELHLHHL